jgi:hypothetical protein
VNIGGDQQLRADPTGPGQRTGLQGPPGELGQGISGPLIPMAGVVGASGAGQRLQGRQHEVAGFGFQQPADRDHGIQGRGQPQAPALMTPLGPPIGTVRISDLEQMPHRLAKPGRIHLAGGLQQHRLGRPGDLLGELTGALSEHLGMGR